MKKMVSSWLQSILPPWKSRLNGHPLFKYGYILNEFLHGKKAKDTALKMPLKKTAQCSNAFNRPPKLKKEKPRVESSQHIKQVERPSNLKKEKPRVESSEDIKQVEKVLGYSFSDRSLLRQAFTHSSYSRNSKSYERLEYMGDSVLNFLITTRQYSLYPELPPGYLTPLRAANVDTEKLARVAVKHDFHKYLRHGMPYLSKQIQTFVFCLPKYPLHSHGLIVAPKVLADVVESTIGAVYIDSNSSLDTTWEVTKSLLDPIITPGMLQTNPVTRLFKICQRHKLEVKIVDLWDAEKSCEVFVDNQLRGRGTCRSKKDTALNRAANAAYDEVVKNLAKP